MSSQLRLGLLLFVSLAGCAAKLHHDSALPDPSAERAELIKSPQLYSAWDGVHEYALIPWVPRASSDAEESDAVDPQSVRWQVDSEFLHMATYQGLPGGVLLKTQRAGSTDIHVSAVTRAGLRVKDSASVEITEATPEQWSAGELAYRWEEPQWFRRGQYTQPCGFVFNLDSPCTRCHEQSTSVEGPKLAVLQQFSDDVLARLFSEAFEPEGFSPNPRAFEMFPGTPKCFMQFAHTWEIPEDLRQAIVVKLRSTPAP